VWRTRKESSFFQELSDPFLDLTLTPTNGQPWGVLGIEDYRKKSFLPIQEIKTISKHFRWPENRGDIARLSKKAPWLLHAISGSLKINKLQAMENQKMIELGVFRQSQQCKKLLPKYLNHYMLGGRRQGHF